MYMLVMALSFAVHLLLLLGTDRLFSQSMLLMRGLFAAALGSLYTGMCMLPELALLGVMPIRIGVLIGIGCLAYGWSVRELLVFCLLNLAIGGGRIWSILAAIAVLVLTLKGRRRCVPVELQLGGQIIRFMALKDTGNTLIDPLSGRRVLVVGADIAREMLGLTPAELENPVETLQNRRDFALRLIPYNAVGSTGNLLLAVRPEQLRIGRHRRGDLVAFAPQVFGTTYKALAGGI